MTSPTATVQALAARVRQQRLDRGLTQSNVAAMANVTIRTYERFEKTGEISLERLVAVFDALGLKDQIDQLAVSGAVPRSEVVPFPVRKRGRRKVNPGVSGGSSGGKGAADRAAARSAAPRAVAPAGAVAPVRSPVADPRRLGANPVRSPQPAPQPAVGWTSVPAVSATPNGAELPPPLDDQQQARYARNVRQIVSDVVRYKMSNDRAIVSVQRDVELYFPVQFRAAYRSRIEAELRRLSPPNLAEYNLSPEAFAAWQKVWNPELGLGK